MTDEKKKYRVLVVDDEPEVRGVAVSFVNCYANNHEVEVEILPASDGANALEIMASLNGEGKSLDVVVSDINMPNKTGLDVLKEGRQLFPGAGYILWSARMVEYRQAVTALGAVALDKPVKMAKFFEALAKYIPSAGKA